MSTDELRKLICCFCVLLLSACLPQDRINKKCEWIGDPPRVLDISRDADARHLDLDANLAEDLGIRYGDTFRSTDGIVVGGEKRGECTEKLLAFVATNHRVSRKAVESARGARNVWIDIALVYIPMLIAFTLIAYLMAARVKTKLYDEQRWMMLGAYVFATPVIAAFGLMAGQQYEWLVEWARLRNAHLSYRAFGMPITHHARNVFIVAMIVFVCVVLVSDARRGTKSSR